MTTEAAPTPESVPSAAPAAQASELAPVAEQPGAGIRVLLLGAGLSALPFAKYLAGAGYHVIVASRTLAKARELAGASDHTEAVQLDIEQEEGVALLRQLVSDVAAVVSLLPYVFHAKACAVALEAGKHFFTASYTSDALAAMDGLAKEKGVVLLNECGVDPGTDHMSAMRIIDDIHDRGGQVTSFTSFCGGLPAPDSNDTIIGYKISWAPKGILLASKNSAKLFRNGEEVTIPGEVLFDNYELMEVEGMGTFEGYPNRDSTKYAAVYGIEGEVKTLIRGTFRNKGWCGTIRKIVRLGFLDQSTDASLSGCSMADLTRQGAGGVAATVKDGELRAAVAQYLSVEAEDHALDVMQWLGLFSDAEKVAEGATTKLDALCALMQAKMGYAPGQRDMILMQHVIHGHWPDGSHADEHVTSTLVSYGEANGYSAMSRTVSYPLAIAVRMVLEGLYTKPGLVTPIHRELYAPMLHELELNHGIKWVEKTTLVGQQ